MITLGKRSLAAMQGLHPQLVRVIQRAALIATPDQDFTVLEGVRTKEGMWEKYGQGRTAAECAAKGVPTKYSNLKLPIVTWLKNPLMSNHRKMADGFGHAFDAAPWPIDWENTKRFDVLANLMFRAAAIEKVRIRWGADWDQDGNPRERGESDSPHFELAL